MSAPLTTADPSRIIVAAISTATGLGFLGLSLWLGLRHVNPLVPASFTALGIYILLLGAMGLTTPPTQRRHLIFLIAIQLVALIAVVTLIGWSVRVQTS